MDIEVLEQSYMYFKIQAKDQLTPIKITIQLKALEQQFKGRSQDLRVFLSSYTKQPNETENQKYVLNVSII